MNLSIDTARLPGERRINVERRRDQRRLLDSARTFGAALDTLCHPLLIVAPGHPPTVWFANAAARRRLLPGMPLVLDADRLRIAATPAGAQLGRALRLAQLQGPGYPQTVEVRVDDTAGSLVVHVDAIEPCATLDMPAERMLLVEVRERGPSADALNLLCERFGLTPKEAETALGLYAAGSVEALARHAGKSIHTVRSQLKAAMLKTGTRTQAGLVALVGRRLEG
ncbi:helix-turn-helix transcriptional regulator [Rehaibacterium terrae]|uniref:DNA-binding CsgD family transcriptional regulator n=1 Tax=Rehaibacterium terrae TaxID=1341696 RepID=A0A7W7V796_9GAMM|nr:helix-turn-helix transcriptional regulator [Rehaibacterium terrae]MBB5014501.1 DNA-binding CsgD family transcriptional regulator [Rehaibacterium terrae]